MSHAKIAVSELTAIQRILKGGDNGIDQAAKAERNLKKHRMSQQRASGWSNTIANSIKKEKAERTAKLDAIEAEKVKEDMAHEAHMMAERKAIIANANETLYKDNDRIKSFESAMIYCDVLAERAAQIQLKDEISRVGQIKEARYVEMGQQNSNKMAAREMREQRVAKEKQDECTAYIAQQKASLRDKKLQQLQDQMIEGQLMMKKAAKDNEEKKTTEKNAKLKQIQALVASQKANEYLREVKQQEAMRAKAEEVKIKQYAAHKDLMEKLTKEKKASIQKAKLDQQLAMIAKAEKFLAAQMGQTEQREEQAARDAEAGQREMEEEKKRKNAAWQADCDRSCKLAREQKQAAAEAETLAELRALEHSKKVAAKMSRDESEENQRDLFRKRNNAQYLLRQAEQKRRVEKQEMLREAKLVAKAQEADMADLVEFNSYAETMIRSYAQQGANVIPLIQQMKKARPGL